jgi:hypothetical protein
MNIGVKNLTVSSDADLLAHNSICNRVTNGYQEIVIYNG